MKISTQLFSLVFYCFFTLSCGSDFYIPDQSNLLVLEKKKDLKASIAFNHVQAAYSPINHIGIKADYNFTDVALANSDRSLNKGTVGLGYYTHQVVKPLRKSYSKIRTNPKLCLIGIEAYANISQGKFIASSNPTTRGIFTGFPVDQGFRVFEANLLNPHISSQVYWQSQSFSLHFGCRAGLLYYYNGVGIGDYTEQERRLAASLIEDTPIPNVEFDIMLSKGNERLETFAQLSWNKSNNRLIDNSASFSFGLKMDIPSLINSMRGIK